MILSPLTLLRLPFNSGGEGESFSNKRQNIICKETKGQLICSGTKGLASSAGLKGLYKYLGRTRFFRQKNEGFRGLDETEGQANNKFGRTVQ